MRGWSYWRMKNISDTLPSALNILIAWLMTIILLWLSLQNQASRILLLLYLYPPPNVYIFIHEKHEIGSTITNIMVSVVLPWKDWDQIYIWNIWYRYGKLMIPPIQCPFQNPIQNKSLSVSNSLGVVGWVYILLATISSTFQVCL